MNPCGTDLRNEREIEKRAAAPAPGGPERSQWNTPYAELYPPTPCTRCGKTLTAKKSVIRKIGPGCLKMQLAAERG